KTKQMRNLLQSLRINGGSALLLVKELNENVLLAARNLRNLMVVRADYSSTLDLLSSKTLIIETGAVEIINKMFDQTKKTAEREVQ
ncbi:MAG: 50S ribosomal protein L4, partial [Candidatus Marinimicrobia bacterium]|nr:50S ribosomal protein L4 [Candidatus Neomarinimicrobiota bacterium]